MRRLLQLALLLLSCAAIAQSQGVRYDNISLARGGFPAAGVTVAVCTQPANVTTTPCSTLATLYTDTTKSTACSGVLLPPPSTPSQPCSNPFLTDGLGNYHFYVTPGTYTIQIYGSGITTQVFYDQCISCSSSSSSGSQFIISDDQVSLTATRGPITLLTGTGSTGGHYRLCYAEEVTTADASGRTVIFKSNFISHSVSRFFSGSAIAVAQTNGEESCVAINLDNNVNITYTVTASGAFTTANYAIDVWLYKE